ncbi:MAG: AAA family ATPase [Proteobacteria bacterium]|nr:AAA family ATPase [Pseudomonadota bacterium]
MPTIFFEHKDLFKSINHMARSGGKLQKASDRIRAIRSKIQLGDKDPFHGVAMTNHGESRIDKCIKYDLTGFARLVTIVEKNLVCLRFAGSHEEVDKWLDRNRGLRLAVSNDKDLVEIHVSNNTSSPDQRIKYQPDNYDGPILDRLDQDYRIKLLGDLPGKVTEPIRDLRSDASEEKILQELRRVPAGSHHDLLFDVFVLLGSGNIKGAENRINLYFPDDNPEKLVPAEQISEEDILEIREGEAVKEIKIGSPEYEKWIDSYLKSSDELDWFLFMHPEQKKFVDTDYAGPTKLSGVSGSGKTGIAVRRAVRLAEKYSGQDIALITLNRSLSSLISNLVDHICYDKETRSRIHVFSFFQLCQNLLKECEPGNERSYSDTTWNLGEHIDEIFREFYRCQAAYDKAEVLTALHKSLTALGIDAETYIREEFDWLRSAVPPDQRSNYLDIERSGRIYPIDKPRRAPILKALEYWEEKMSAVGVSDYLGLTTALFKHRENISPKFRAIVVDEAQDFGTTELELLRHLVAPDENDMFFCGDLAQHILPKHQSFAQAGIEVTGRSFSIQRNYRNSREILRAAYEVLCDNLEEAMMRGGDMEILDPEYATRSASVPVVLEAESLEEEIACAMALMADNAEIFSEREFARLHRGCIVIAGYSLYEISIFGEQVGLPVLDGSLDATNGELFLSDLEQTKGYEFDTLAVLNCAENILPPSGAPAEETFRFGCQLYVAMTRARDLLVLSHSGAPSKWLKQSSEVLTWGSWDNYVDIPDIKLIGSPGFLPEVPDSEDDTQAIMKLHGRGFGYTMYARGLSGEILDKMEELVPESGRSRSRDGIRVQWNCVGQLHKDMQAAAKEKRPGYIFGLQADSAVFAALELAKSGSRPLARRELIRKQTDIEPLPGADLPDNATDSGNPRRLEHIPT